MAETSPMQCTLKVSRDSGHQITFYREIKASEGAEFSVTLGDGTDSPDTQWGEFFDKEEAALLYLWLGERLKELV